MEGVEELPPSKRVKISGGETSGIMDRRHLENEFLGPKGIIKKVEFVRTITETLHSLGYKKTKECLEGESGIQLHSPAVKSLIQQVLDGNWDESVTTLSKIGILDESTIYSASLMILVHKFFELLDKERYVDALHTLRVQIVSLGVSIDKVKQLSSCIVFPGNSMPRSQLLVELQRVFPPSVIIAENRLLKLVEQTIDIQRDACMFHNVKVEDMSLFVDHHCGRDKLPIHTSQVLWEHKDEVWFLQFSHDGKYLASSSKDLTVIVWEVKADDQVVLKYKLNGHRNPVSFISWSPDNKQLLSCGVGEEIRRWDISTGECLRIYRKDNVGMLSCGWAPDGKYVYASVNDKSIIMWGLEGNEIEWKQGLSTIEISDLGIINDGKSRVLTVSKDNALVSVDLTVDVEPNRNPCKVIVEVQPIVSFSLSRDRKYVLINLINQEIHLWNIVGVPKLMVTYKGHKHTRFVLRSCFGGVDQGFVASGSEDSQVYIWLRKSGELITKLPGHSATVNSVSWNPERPLMLASASDDHTIRIWGLKKMKMEIGNCSSSSSSSNKGGDLQSNGNGNIHQNNGGKSYGSCSGLKK